MASDDETKRKEGKAIVEGLAKLKYELQHDRQLTYEYPSTSAACTLADRCRPLVDDGKPDISDYNQQLESLGSSKWFSVPWLFAECYLYRYNERDSPKLRS